LKFEVIYQNIPCGIQPKFKFLLQIQNNYWKLIIRSICSSFQTSFHQLNQVYYFLGVGLVNLLGKIKIADEVKK